MRRGWSEHHLDEQVWLHAMWQVVVGWTFIAGGLAGFAYGRDWGPLALVPLGASLVLFWNPVRKRRDPRGPDQKAAASRTMRRFALVALVMAMPVLFVIAGMGLANRCTTWLNEMEGELGHRGHSILYGASLLPPGLRCTGVWPDGTTTTGVVPWERPAEGRREADR